MDKIFEYIKKYDILILVILGVLLYYPALSFNFLDYDDFSLILENQYLNGKFNIKYFEFFIPSFVRGDIYIPLTFIVYWSIIKIFGISSFAFHFLNIAFYISSVIALFYLLKKMINNYSVVFVATVLYILHPCHIECTAWISAMGYNIAGLFFYLSFLYFIIAFDENKKINYVYSIIFYILAILSQPIAVTLPAILLLWVYCFRRERVKESIKYISAYVPFLFIYLYLFFQTILKLDRFSKNLNYSLLEKFSICGFNLFNCILPINLCPIHSEPSLLFIISLFIFAILLYFFRKNINYLFFCGFGIICILPYLNLFFNVNIPMADRYLVFSSVSSCVLISYLSFYILEKFQNKQLLKYISFIFIIFFYLFSFIIYLPIWENSRNFWSYTYNVSDNFITISGYSQILLEDGRYDEALILADKLIQKAPKAFEGYEIKIRALLGKGFLNEALNIALKRKTMNSDDYEIYLYLFDIYIMMQDYDSAQKSLDMAYVKIKEYDLYKNEVINKFLNKKMLLAFVMVKTNEFIENFKVISNDFRLLQDKGCFSKILNYNDYKSRREICLNYLQYYTEYSKSVIRLLNCLYMEETYKDDASEVMKFLLKEMNRAQEFINKNDYNSAENIYKNIIKKNKYMYDAYYNLGILYYNTKQMDKAKKVFDEMLKINSNDEQIKQLIYSLGEDIKK